MLTFTIATIIISVIIYRIGRYEGAEQYKKLIEEKQAQLSPAVNYICGQVYPDPADPRWKLIKCKDKKYISTAFKFGDIEVYIYSEQTRRGALFIRPNKNDKREFVASYDTQDEGEIEQYWIAINRGIKAREIQRCIENVE